MKSALQILLAALAVSLATSGSYYGRRSSGRSQSAITFTNSRRPPGPPVGSSVQFGETHATSVQNSTGDGQQTNRGEAGAVSVQKQTGLGGATQATNNQGTIESLQKAEGGGGGGKQQQSSNNQVTINSSQLQQNVDGTLVNVQAGHEGVVIINTNDETGGIVNQEVINNRPIAGQTPDSATCRYLCRHPHRDSLYCCDDGTNAEAEWNIHGGDCPAVRGLCPRKVFFTKCAHDGQCAPSDKCCFDTCAERHICKKPVRAY